MILFTGGGAIANAFSNKYPCKIISSRNMQNEELIPWILKAEVIIHNAAALTNGISINEFIQSNFLLTKRIADLANEINPSVKFINISSMSILANSEDYANIDKMSDYTYSKFISEQYCIRLNLEKSTNIRFSTIFYGNETKDGISKLIYDSITNNEITIYNDGTASRDIIPLSILCDYLFKIANLDQFESKMNIVSGKKTTFSTIVDLLKKQNNQLVIHNIGAKFNDVLADFSKDSILKIGEIPFDLEAELLTYYRKVNEMANL